MSHIFVFTKTQKVNTTTYQELWNMNLYHAKKK